MMFALEQAVEGVGGAYLKARQIESVCRESIWSSFAGELRETGDATTILSIVRPGSFADLSNDWNWYEKRRVRRKVLGLEVRR